MNKKRLLTLMGASKKYWQIVKNVFGSDLLVYYPMEELSGTVIVDKSDNKANGVYKGAGEPLLAQPGIKSNTYSPLFDGTNDFANIYTEYLKDNINGSEGSISGFFKVTDDAEWVDSTKRFVIDLFSATNEYIQLYKSATSYQLIFEYRAAATVEAVGELYMENTAWNHFCITWSKSNERVRCYINGYNASTFTSANLGIWGGTLGATVSCIGALATNGSNPWKGYISNVAIGKRELTSVEVNSLVSPILTERGLFIVGDSKSLATQNWYRFTLGKLNELGYYRHKESPTRFATGGHTWALMKADIDSSLAAATGTPSICVINLGANDVASLPVEATIKADMVSIINSILAKWNSTKIYIAKVWRRSYAAECNTLAGYIDDVVALYSSNVFVGMDERVWLEGGDDGATNTTDGIHYSDAGQVAAATAWRAVIT